PAGQVEQVTSVGGNQFDDEIELPCRRNHVVRLRPASDRVRCLLRRAGRLDTDQSLLVAESEWIRDGDDLEDALRRQPSVTSANGRFRTPDARGDRSERLASIRL